MDPKLLQPAEAQGPALSASARVVMLRKGMFVVSVANGRPTASREAEGLTLPALHVGLAPGVSRHDAEFLAAAETEGQWLTRSGQLLVVKVTAATAQLLLTSVRTAGGPALDVSIARLDGAPAPAEKAGAVTDRVAPDAAKAGAPAPKVQIGCHVRGRGDVTYVDAEWAGRIATGAWIEAYSILPLEVLSPDEIEYKGLTSSGFETPWLTGGAACGTRGMAVPLVGFAVRRGAKATHVFDCEYSGFFRSGVVVGPLRNGTPCRSTQAGDPLEGIRFRWLPRTDAAEDAATAKPSSAKRADKKAKQTVKFGRYRDSVGNTLPADLAETRASPAKPSGAKGRSKAGSAKKKAASSRRRSRSVRPR